jgi:hypothetical protein
VYCIDAQRERNILQRQNLQVSRERESALFHTELRVNFKSILEGGGR